MLTVGDALGMARGRIDRLDADLLLGAVLGVNRAGLIARPERLLADVQRRQFEDWIARRAQGEPVAYLLGTREFYGRDFAVSPAVLIPRPETELLVDQALARLTGQKWLEKPASPRVLDMGTGSGAIACTLALERPDWQVAAIDASAEALAVARRNAAALGARVEFHESNWYSALGTRRFDLIVSNPPYVGGEDPHLGQGDLRFEPSTALTDGSADGLASIRAIVDGARDHLAPGGDLLFEHGYDQADAARKLLLKAGFGSLICVKDLAGIPRVAGGRLG